MKNTLGKNGGWLLATLLATMTARADPQPLMDSDRLTGRVVSLEAEQLVWMPVGKTVNIGTQVNWDYDNLPAPGKKSAGT